MGLPVGMPQVALSILCRPAAGGGLTNMTDEATNLKAAGLGITKDQFRARTLLDSGCAAIADGNPAQAEQCFRESKRLEPGNATARFYLSVALTLQHAPGCPGTQHFLEESERELLECLRLDLDADDRRAADENLTAVRYLLNPMIGSPLGK